MNIRRTDPATRSLALAWPAPGPGATMDTQAGHGWVRGEIVDPGRANVAWKQGPRESGRHEGRTEVERE
jgi:hypothetical protein